jgi:hypothetical protein
LTKLFREFYRHQRRYRLLLWQVNTANAVESRGPDLQRIWGSFLDPQPGEQRALLYFSFTEKRFLTGNVVEALCQKGLNSSSQSG